MIRLERETEMGVHDGHRERLRDSFLEHGLDPMNDLNALELLLFYAIPRRDTNPIAHALLDHFGSLSAVFEASERELCEVPGIGKSAAALILLIPQMMRKSAIGKVSDMRCITNSEDAGKYLLPRYMGERDEVFMMVCLDSQQRIIACIELSRGTVTEVDVSIRRVAETALKYKASYVVVAHNHPDGVALPSSADHATTRAIYRALMAVQVTLFDHIIIAGDDYVSFRDSGMLSQYRY